MEREITIKVNDYRVDDAYGGGKKFVVTTQVAETVMERFIPTVMEKVVLEIGNRITEEWLKTYGQDVLAQLAPTAIADAIRLKVTEQVYKTMGINK